MEVGIFTDSANHPRFDNMLRKFASGVQKTGDIAFCTAGKYSDCDVAVIFGSWKDRDTLWHNVKRDVVARAKNFICIETPLVGRGEVKDVGDDNWYRVGINGFLADTGNFNNKRKPIDRWLKVKEELEVELYDYEQGDDILVALQVPGDASLRGKDINWWTYEICHEIRKYSDRKIIIRTPQVLKTFDLDILYSIRDRLPKIDYEIGSKENLISSIKNSWATVTYSSGLGIDSYLAGVPSFTIDKGNFAYSLGNTNIKNIEKPALPDRQQWLNNLCYAQWNDDEMSRGIVWKHLKEALLKL